MCDKKILVLTDNGVLYLRLLEVISKDFSELLPCFDFRRSRMTSNKRLYTIGVESLEEIDVKKEHSFIIQNYKLVISLHCKQIFPEELVKNVLCVNIHPGYNPYNRGWYPQVFAIMNGTQLGATIHVMDEQIDHGSIIARKKVQIESWYTSKEAYDDILEAEVELFKKNIQNIVSNNFISIEPEIEGDYHSINDYKKLCKLNLEEQITLGGAINKLRALSHGEYNNAYFFDEKGNKVFVKIELMKED